MNKYLGIKGRLNRTEFFVASVLLILLFSIANLIWNQDSKEVEVVFIVLIIVYLIQCSKRYHDLNLNGFYGFIWWIIPFVNLIFLIQLYFFKGTDGLNKYGDRSSFSMKDLFKGNGNETEKLPNDLKTEPSVLEYSKGNNYQKNSSKKMLNNIDDKPSKLGKFDLNDFPVELRNKEFYFYEYDVLDGGWVEKDDPICKIRIGENEGDLFNGGIVKASKNGILEWTSERDEILTNGKVIYKLHEIGEYQNENSPENFEYKEYFISSSSKLYFDEWFVLDGDFVKVGEPIFQFTDFEGRKQVNHSKKEGFVHKLDPKKKFGLKKNELIYIIRDTDKKRIKERYENTPNIIFDEFTKTTNIKWNSVSSDYPWYEGVRTKSDDLNTNLLFSFNYLNGNDYIVFHFNPKQIRPRQYDKIYFLFENSEQILFELTSNPIQTKNRMGENVLEYKNLITIDELELFITSKFEKWKISLIGDQKDVLGGNMSESDLYPGRNNIQIVIKKFANDYLDLVESEIPDYQPIKLRDVEEIKETTIDSCFVYLMHDTSNDYYKIGISNKPDYREKTLQSEKPTIELLASRNFPIRKIAESIEKALHEAYSEKRLRGEWFDLNQDDVENIRKSLK